MPRFSDLWTGGNELSFPSSPMPPSVTDTRAPPPSAAFAKAPAPVAGATATTSTMVDRQPSALRGFAEGRAVDATVHDEHHTAALPPSMDHSWAEGLLGDDDTWDELPTLSAHTDDTSAAPPTADASLDLEESKQDACTDIHLPTTRADGIDVEPSAVARATGELQPPVIVAPQPLLTLRRRRRALVWFRQDLRLHDNLALQGALTAHGTSDLEILPVYIIHKPEKKKCGAVRFQFLLECLADLRHSLQRRGSDLLVLRGEAIDVLRMVLPAWGITDLFYEEFVMPYATKRDDEVNRIALASNTQVHTYAGRTLFDPKAILKKNDGRVCTDFSKFVKIVQELPQPPMPVAAPATIPSMETTTAELCETLASFCGHYQTPISYDDLTGAKAATEPFSVPELAEFGHAVPQTHSFLYGGETIALQALEEFCANEERVGLFEKPRTSPACTDKQSTTTLSPYITFGCLSLREFFYRIMFIQLKFPGRQGPPPVTLDGQLMWREFFYCFGVGVKSFDTQDDNPMCMQINWKLPELPTNDSSQWSEETKTAMDQLRAWREGRTGYPWIDAVLRQIEQDGWAHHVARHAVACFLTRGDLYISWLRGAYFFQEKLIDMDWPINIGNWLWVSSSCFFHDYHQIHSPSLYVQAWDPRGNFIRKWVPALKDMPARYIFEPWKAPLSVQRTAGCLIGKDYPFPIVDHSSAMKKCVQWHDGSYAQAHQHDGVLAPCCDHNGKDQCHFTQRQKATQEQQHQQQAEVSAVPPKKRARHG